MMESRNKRDNEELGKKMKKVGEALQVARAEYASHYQSQQDQQDEQGDLPSLPEIEVSIVYTNWKGKTSIRRIIPSRLVFDCNQYHPQKQWLLHAFDVDKKANRTFAMRDISTWGTAGE